MEKLRENLTAKGVPDIRAEKVICLRDGLEGKYSERWRNEEQGRVSLFSLGFTSGKYGETVRLDIRQGPQAHEIG